MFQRHFIITMLYAGICMVHLLAIWFGNQPIETYSKPFITVSLITALIIRTHLKGRFLKRIAAGLIFALAGDVLLNTGFDDQGYFLYGLLAFLVCQISYTAAFYLDFSSAPELDKPLARIAIVTFSVLGMAFYLLLRPGLGTMKLPVMAYIFGISFMAMMAVFRRHRVCSESFYLILTGVLFFMLSDAMLAYSKFIGNFTASNLMIMATYCIAQYLLVIGAMERRLTSIQ